MFCAKCGHKLSQNAAFCTQCGTKAHMNDEKEVTTQSTSPQSIDEISSLPKKNMPVKWIVALLCSLFIASGLIYYFIHKQSPSQETAKTQTENKLSATDTKSSQTTAANNVPLKPSYIKVNQVDSTNYSKGVDIYFSLFSDQGLTNQLEPMSLTKNMFKVNGNPVEHVSFVKQAEAVSVNLVIDRSGSMTESPYNGVTQSKMELVRKAAKDFIINIPSDAKGNFELLPFSTYAPTMAAIPFSNDREQLVSCLSTLESDGGQTALYDSLTKALYDTNTQHGPKYIIAFTDGQDSNYGSSAYSVIELSKQLGIPIYTIGFGEADEELQKISTQTGGQYFTINTTDDLYSQLHKIYGDVFQTYTQQYKLTYIPTQQIAPGGTFSLDLTMKTPEYEAKTENLPFMRKIDASSTNVLNGLFEYQVQYAEAVNRLDFNIVSPHVKFGSAFYKNLQNRIEVDYVNANRQGKPKIIEPLKNYRVESITAQNDGSYVIEFFKFFPVTINNEKVFEADLNTYTLVQDPASGKWQVSNFNRKECSIYKNENDPGSLYPDSGVTKRFSRNPWMIH